jgi:hypothetical protein
MALHRRPASLHPLTGRVAMQRAMAAPSGAADGMRCGEFSARWVWTAMMWRRKNSDGVILASAIF